MKQTSKETIKHMLLMVLVILTGHIPQLNQFDGYGMIILAVVVGLYMHWSSVMEDLKC